MKKILHIALVATPIVACLGFAALGMVQAPPKHDAIVLLVGMAALVMLGGIQVVMASDAIIHAETRQIARLKRILNRD